MLSENTLPLRVNFKLIMFDFEQNNIRDYMFTELDLDNADAFYKLINIVKTGIYWKDKEGRYLGCNDYLLKMLGLIDQDQVIGKTDNELWDSSEKDLSVWIKSDQFALTNGQYEIEALKTISGERKLFSIIKTRLVSKDGNAVGILGSCIDISEQKKSLNLKEQKLFLDEQLKITQIIDSVNANIYWKNLQGTMLGCNQYVLDMFGVSEKEQIVGKNEYDLVLLKEQAEKINEIDQSVIKNGRYVGEEIFTIASGKEITVLTVKNQLKDSDGNVIGLIGTSLDITAQKEVEKLREERQQALLREKEKLIALAHQVAHDISSPVSALSMMMQMCDELPEGKRAVIENAAQSILDIANNLLSTYRNDEQRTVADSEQRQPLLVSDWIAQLLSEKKVQYSNHTVRFETDIANDAQFAFVQMQASQFRRSLSNLINNAVDALDKQRNGLITVGLTIGTESATIAIHDNGKGMPASTVEKIVHRQHFTEGKSHGHGLGLQQVWDTLDANRGTMNVISSPGKGTNIQLIFSRIAAPNWIAQAIQLAPNSIIVILDDDESVHGAWDARLVLYCQQYPALRVRHFKQGQDVLAFLCRLTPVDQNRVVFLSDYELLRQNKNGLQIIEASKIKNATLVTSYYATASVRDNAVELGVKILPKQMASAVRIDI